MAFALALLAVAGLLALPGVLGTRPPAVQAQAGSAHTICPTGKPDCNFAVVQEALGSANDGGVIELATGAYSGVKASTGVTQLVYISIRKERHPTFEAPPGLNPSPTARL